MEISDSSTCLAFVHNIRIVYLGYGLLVALKSWYKLVMALVVFGIENSRVIHILLYRVVPAGADWSHLTFKQCLLQRSPYIIALLSKVNCQFAFKYYVKVLA